MPTKKEIILINSAVDILAEVCTAKPEKVIEWMTGYLWDKDEAAAILEFRPTPRALDADTWACKKCTRLSSNFRVNCFWCGHPRQ